VRAVSRWCETSKNMDMSPSGTIKSDSLAKKKQVVSVGAGIIDLKPQLETVLDNSIRTRKKPTQWGISVRVGCPTGCFAGSLGWWADEVHGVSAPRTTASGVGVEVEQVQSRPKVWTRRRRMGKWRASNRLFMRNGVRNSKHTRQLISPTSVSTDNAIAVKRSHFQVPK